MQGKHNQEANERAAVYFQVAQQEARRLGAGDDSLTECYLILVEAAASWKSESGVPFPAWARHLIRLRFKRRRMDDRVIKVPAKIRAKLALLIDELDRKGCDLESPTSVRYDTSVLAAMRVLQPLPLDGVDQPWSPQDPAITSVEPAGMNDVLKLRYGYHGDGMRTVSEVARITGLRPREVLQQDAAFIQMMRARSRTS